MRGECGQCLWEVGTGHGVHPSPYCPRQGLRDSVASCSLSKCQLKDPHRHSCLPTLLLPLPPFTGILSPIKETMRALCGLFCTDPGQDAPQRTDERVQGRVRLSMHSAGVPRWHPNQRAGKKTESREGAHTNDLCPSPPQRKPVTMPCLDNGLPLLGRPGWPLYSLGAGCCQPTLASCFLCLTQCQVPQSRCPGVKPSSCRTCCLPMPPPLIQSQGPAEGAQALGKGLAKEDFTKEFNQASER